MIEKASPSELKEIAEVHMECFPHSFLTKYGPQILSRYYGEYLAEDAPFIIARREKTVGFCMGYIGQSKAKNRFLKKNFFSLSIKTLGRLLAFDKSAYKKIFPGFHHSVDSKVEEEKVEDEAYLLSICVLQEERGTGLSQQLVEEFEKQLIEKNCKSYVLFAEEDNERGIGFYKKMGFRQVRIKDGSIKFYKKLDQNNGKY